MLFLGTPHQGSKAASLGRIVYQMSKLLIPKPNIKVLRGIEVNSETLEEICSCFAQILDMGQLQIHSFQEELSTNGVMIVESFSSAINHSRETRGTLYADHRNMARFSSIDDINFKRVTAVLSRWIQRNPLNNIMDTSSSNAMLMQSSDSEPWHRKYKECLESLDNTMARRRIDMVEPAYLKTYEWLFRPELGFTDWLAGKNPDTRFWIQGRPASGKSTLMKFAMNHPTTRMLLKSYNDQRWIIAGYFFHDHGSDLVQKSALGFLQEIFYQILRQQPESFSFVSHLFDQLLKAQAKISEAKHQRELFVNSWTTSVIEQGIALIKANVVKDVNLFLVVDALDEHEGNHRELLAILNRIAQPGGHSHFRLRLCLAGRPENVFKDSLQHCPGFAIHEHTANDIYIYTQERIETETNSDRTDECEKDISLLVETIVEKAHRVFLWVRLVVDEMIEGLCDGDTIAELEDLLSTIPIELEELYTRALRRARRTSRRHRVNSSDENGQAYAMFRIVLSSLVPLKLATLLEAAVFLTAGNRLRFDFAQVQKLSKDQMHRRLYSRSGGLLEDSADRVQFMHQTVKEYMIVGDGAFVISQGNQPDLRQSGNVMIVRYLLKRLEESGSDPNRYVRYLKDHRQDVGDSRHLLNNIKIDATLSIDPDFIIDDFEDSDIEWAITLGDIDKLESSDAVLAETNTDAAKPSLDIFSHLTLLSRYLRVIETQELTCMRAFFEPTILKASKIIRLIFFKQILHCGYYLIRHSSIDSLAKRFGHSYWRKDIIRRNDRPEIQMLVYYALNDMHLSFKESIALHRDDLRREDIECLRQAASIQNFDRNLSDGTMETWTDYIPEMSPTSTGARDEVGTKIDFDIQQF